MADREKLGLGYGEALKYHFLANRLYTGWTDWKIFCSLRDKYDSLIGEGKIKMAKAMKRVVCEDEDLMMRADFLELAYILHIDLGLSDDYRATLEGFVNNLPIEKASRKLRQIMENYYWAVEHGKMDLKLIKDGKCKKKK